MPWVSIQQRRWAMTPAGRAAGFDARRIAEWDAATDWEALKRKERRGAHKAERMGSTAPTAGSGTSSRGKRKPSTHPEIGRIGPVRFPWPDVQPDTGRPGMPIRFPSTASLQLTPTERGLPFQQVTLYPRGYPPLASMSPYDAWRRNPVGYGFRIFPQPGPTIFPRLPGRQWAREMDEHPNAARDAAIVYGGSALLGGLAARRLNQQWGPVLRQAADYPRRVDAVRDVIDPNTGRLVRSRRADLWRRTCPKRKTRR